MIKNNYENEDKYDFVKYINNWANNLKRRFYNKKSLYDICHDKYQTYLFCKSLDIPTAELFYYGKIKNYDFSKLPNNYVVKPVDGASSKGVFVMKNNINQLDKKKYSVNEIKLLLKDKICLIEEYINDNNKDVPVDYKVFVVKDKVIAIQVIDSRKINKKKMIYKKRFYDENWKDLPLITHGTLSEKVEAPRDFEKLLYYSRKIGKIIDTVMRIDFYIGNNGIVFGEFTPHPSGATGYTDFGKKYLNEFMKKYNITNDDTPYDIIKYFRGTMTRQFSNKYKYNGKSIFNIQKNKLNTYEVVSKLNINIPKLYYSGLVDNVNFEKLPKSYVIKPIDDYLSRGVFLMENGYNKLSNRKTNIDEIIQKFKNKKCIIEEKLINYNGLDVLDDIKVFTFNGIPEIIQIRRLKDNIKNKQKGNFQPHDYEFIFYDNNFNDIGSIQKNVKLIKNYKYSNKDNQEILRLSNYIGNKLCKNIIIRIDLFNTTKGIYFGEFAIHPCGFGSCFNERGILFFNNLMRKHNIKWYNN